MLKISKNLPTQNPLKTVSNSSDSYSNNQCGQVSKSDKLNDLKHSILFVRTYTRLLPSFTTQKGNY